MTMFRRVWDSPMLIPVLSIMTVVALAAAAFAVFGVLASDRDRERERIAADNRACERGNTLRGQVVDLGEANELLVEGVLDVILVFVNNPDTVHRIRTGLDPVFDQHRNAVDAIQLVDCERLVPGSTSTSLPGRNP